MFSRMLIANRGEIALRLMRAAEDLRIMPVCVYARDDARSLHVLRAAEAVALERSGAAAYLDIAAIVDAAVRNRCEAIHPGYGFLSESPELARACKDAGIVFVGPPAETLELFGDKARARTLAEQCGVSTPPGIARPVTLGEAQDFFRSQPAGARIMLKAVAGGGGRGIRLVDSIDELETALARCQSEALAAFGNDSVYLERFLDRARHIEVQVAGDGSGAVLHLWERECTLQRRHQKLIEVAPSPTLPDEVRAGVIEAAVTLATATNYLGLGTFEFLVWQEADEWRFAFIEANPRVQVEHTITEAVTGIDLVQLQIKLLAGIGFAELGLDQSRIARPRGYAIQSRVNMETMRAGGEVHPTGGTFSIYEPPGGPGVRVDGFGYTGYTTSPAFDSLLAKIIVHTPADDYPLALGRMARALREFRIEGVQTNIPFLRALLERPEVRENLVHTRFVDEKIDRGREAGGRRIHEDGTSGDGAGQWHDCPDRRCLRRHAVRGRAADVAHRGGCLGRSRGR